MKVNLELIIDSSAFVTKTAQIKVLPKPTPKDNDSSAANDDDADTITTKNVQLTISHGNVFHPQSNLIIYIPQKKTHSKDYKLKIGEFNLFEEESQCYLEVTEDIFGGGGDSDGNNDEENKESISMTLMGSYNQFTPRCKVHTHTIGNGNIFHPFCDLYFIHGIERNEMMMIGNGNIFNSFVSMKNVRNNNWAMIHESDDSKDDTNDITSNSYQNQVFFILSPPSSVPVSSSFGEESNCSKIMQRTNENGVRKNMNDVTLLLSATKNIFIKKKKDMMR